MLETIPAKDRFNSKDSSLDTFHLFSFGSYSAPKNSSFKCLRVFNDDTVEAGAGFPLHPHRDYEILTIVLEGALTHADNAGNQGTIGKNCAQRISAGSGILHSEFNMGNAPCRLFQIWFSPNKRGHPTSYETAKGILRKNCLVPLASGKPGTGRKKSKTRATLKANAEVFLLELSTQKAITLPFPDFFIYAFSGKLSLDDSAGNRKILLPGDQVRALGEKGAVLRGVSGVPKAVIISFF
ncbi:MAG: pirin family protein [archaeon]